MRSRARIAAAAALLAVAALVPHGSAAQPATALPASAPDFARSVRAVPRGGRLVVQGLRLEGAPEAQLNLTEAYVWAPGAVLQVDGVDTPLPNDRYFRGSLQDDPSSLAFLHVSARDGSVGGMVFAASGAHEISNPDGPRSAGLRTRRADFEDPRFKATVANWTCGTASPGGDDGHSHGNRRLHGLSSDGPALWSGLGRALLQNDQVVFDAPLTANLAIDADTEFFELFRDPTATTRYIASLIGYVDLLYSREVDVNIRVSNLRIFTDRANEPFSGADTAEMLNSFTDHWRQNTGIPRTLAHLLSGKNLGGGRAFLSALCNPQIDTGVTANMGDLLQWDGNQNNNPARVVWDVVAFAHELGHNFGSSHTHEYCRIGGVAQPVDECSQPCNGADAKLPRCSANPTAFRSPGGSGAGTIMSYCHTIGEGMSNVALTFGGRVGGTGPVAPHPCGTRPERVSAVMRATVADASARNPTCFSKVEPPPPPPGDEGCNPPFTVDLQRGSCDGAALTPGAFFTGTARTFDPPLPARLGPGQYTFTITGDATVCQASVTVNPCRPACRDVAVAAPGGECSASIDPRAFLDPATIGRTAQSVELTPDNPFPLGTTPATAVVSYPGGVVSDPTDPGCTVTVSGSAAAAPMCFYQASRSKTYCMDASELVAGTCFNADDVTVTSCELSASTPARRFASHCSPSFFTASVCFPTGKLAGIYGKQGYRKLEVGLLGGDGSRATVEIEVWAKKIGRLIPGCWGV